ncbi:hypothetical protein RB595_004267 [Gaeumannomyces hyphopodioides]
MLSRVIFLAFAAATGLVEAGFIANPDAIFAPGALIARQNRGKFNGGGQNRGGNNAGKNNAGNNNAGNNNAGNNAGNNNAANGACLNQSIKQSASNTDGQEQGTEGIKAGQAKSAKDANNFINFCVGKGQATNGKQNKAGSCNSTPMGQIPASNKMVSVIITNPKPGDKLQQGQTFKINVQTRNLQAGSFTNPTTTYYTAPQALNGQGQVIGHVHVTVQNIGQLAATQPPNPEQFAFFKGIDDAGQGGLVSADVTGGLPAGVYRVCTITSGSNHQPVYMPVAQRGGQDDCTKFEVVANGGGGGGGNNNGGGNNGGNNNQQGKNNQQGQNRGRGRRA